MDTMDLDVEMDVDVDLVPDEPIMPDPEPRDTHVRSVPIILTRNSNYTNAFITSVNVLLARWMMLRMRTPQFPPKFISEVSTS